MKKKHNNYRKNKSVSVTDKNINSDNKIADNEIEEVMNKLEDAEDELVDIGNLDIDDVDIDDMDLDEDMAERLAYYESEVTDEQDESEDEDDISEFVSRDYDIIAESRRRVNQPGSPVQRAGRTRNVRSSKREAERKERKKAADDKNSLTSLINRWLEFYHKYTMNILFTALGVLAAVLVVVIIVTWTTDDKDADVKSTDVETTSQQEQSATDGEQSTEGQTTEPVAVPEAEDSEIHSLIVAYMDAAFIQADMDQVKLYVDDVTNINVDEYKSRQKYIEAYQNIKCYKFDHDEADTYVVFVTYEEKIYNIETPAPSGKLFIIKKNPTDQKLYIHNITEDEELDVYIASKAQQISTISADVSRRLEAAKSSDEDLAAVLELMGNVGKKEEESSSAAPQ